MKLLISSVVANTDKGMSPCNAGSTDRHAPLRSQADTACHSAHVRERFGGCRAKPLTRFEKGRTATSSADFWFGIGSVAAAVRPSARPPLRFFGLRARGARVPWTLNPLVVGSIPTRPTNSNKGLA